MADNFEQLKQKYRPALTLMEQQQVRLQNLHLQDGKIFIRGEAPSQEVKNRIWDQIKLIDPTYSDLTADITVSPQTQAAAAAAQPQPRTYVVKPGDTLSKIAQHFYGSSSAYMRIFEANRDKLSDPDKIRPGQELAVP
jgi:LysM repeat protein